MTDTKNVYAIDYTIEIDETHSFVLGSKYFEAFNRNDAVVKFVCIVQNTAHTFHPDYDKCTFSLAEPSEIITLEEAEEFDGDWDYLMEETYDEINDYIVEAA